MTKSKVKLSLLSYRKSYYLMHPWKFVKDVVWKIKNFIHRGKYGFAYVDAWDWYVWWPKVGAEALRYLAEHGCGYPACDFESFEAYQTYLVAMADRLDWCAHEYEPGVHHHGKENPYKKQYEEINAQRMKRIMDEKGYVRTDFKYTKEDEDVIHHFWEEEEVLNAEDAKERAAIFSEIGEHITWFFD